MAKYLALLRGINVSGHRIIKMKELIEALTESGLKDIKTYIQSGNVIFTSTKKSSTLSNGISDVIFKSFGHEVDVIVRTQKELEYIVKNAPFRKKDMDKKLYVSFLSKKPGNEIVDLIRSLNNPMETFHLIKTELYTIRDPKVSFDKTVLGVLDKKLKMPVTSRNWNVVNKIFDLMQ